MEADFDLDDDGHARPLPRHTGTKGRTERPPSAFGGRPSGFSPNKAADMEKRILAGETPGDDDPESAEGRLSTTVRTNLAKAAKEEALAGLNALELKIKTGQYLPREAFREAAATLVAALSQGLRSLPDTLERKHKLQPEVLQAIEATIDDALNTVADGLALFTEAPA